MRGKYVENQTWDVVARSPGMEVLPTKWVLVPKLHEDKSVTSIKARLVACGNHQSESTHGSTFAKTLTASNFRLFISIIAEEDLEDDSLDAVKALHISRLHTYVYLHPYVGIHVPVLRT